MKINFQDIVTLLMHENNFLITTHESPDGDGLGAEYALYSALIELGKNVHILNSDIAPERFVFFDKNHCIKTWKKDEELPPDLKNWTLLVLDTEPKNIGSLTSSVLDACKRIVVIDHHNSPLDERFNSWQLPESSSTAEMVFRIIESFELKIPQDVAEALYMGILYDTGSFTFAKTRVETFEVAKTLVSCGAVPNKIVSEISENKSTSGLKLFSLVSSTMWLRENDKVAILFMPKETLFASGALYEESQDIINFPLQSRTVRLSIFFKEKDSGVKRCSMRSKGEIDCSAIAQSFGGGGHLTAAGFGFNGNFSDIAEKVLELVRPYFA